MRLKTHVIYSKLPTLIAIHHIVERNHTLTVVEIASNKVSRKAERGL